MTTAETQVKQIKTLKQCIYTAIEMATEFRCSDPGTCAVCGGGDPDDDTLEEGEHYPECPIGYLILTLGSWMPTNTS